MGITISWPKKNNSNDSGTPESYGRNRSHKKQPGFLSTESVEKAKATEDQEHRASEQRYWTQQNQISQGALAVSAAALAFLIVTAIVAYRTFQETRKQAKAAVNSNQINQKNMVASNRAWVAPDFVVLTKPLESGEPLHIQLRLQNTGHQPATGLIWKFNTFAVAYVPIGGDVEISAPNKTCERLDPSESKGVVIYPSSTRVQTQLSQYATRAER
jgi:hypothetical protein